MKDLEKLRKACVYKQLKQHGIKQQIRYINVFGNLDKDEEVGWEFTLLDDRRGRLIIDKGLEIEGKLLN